MRISLTLSIALLFISQARSQDMDLKMGKVKFGDLSMTSYPNDTSASAVILDERGQAYISEQAHEDLIFEHYLKIKILKTAGFDHANFIIALHRNDRNLETLLSVSVSTYNLENNQTKETMMDSKSVFKQDQKYLDRIKFTAPDIRVGSVIEVNYKINSPFYFNFYPWAFQSYIPKVHTEYWALIPANYLYHITMRGFLKLTKDESTLIKDCFSPGGGARADCALYKYGMDNVPAFVEEEDMTAASNFISAIRFELSEVKHFDGRSDRVTKEWKDVDLELKQHDDFGGQIKKARSLFDDVIKGIVGAESDPLKNAKAVYDYVKTSYAWNDNYSKYAELGVKKAFELHKGNDADINLSLVGALQSAGFDASPVILSTRENGLPMEVFPVMSEFNYVIASLEIGPDRYLLDATHNLQPFGFLPLRCLNGKGRLMAKESAWVELKPREKKKTVINMDLTITGEGTIEGKVAITYQGYDAFSKRNEIFQSNDTTLYRKKLQDELGDVEIQNYQRTNTLDLDKPLTEKMEIRLSSQNGSPTIYFSPFLFEKIIANPFKSSERLYPVDFGAPRELVLILNLNNQSGYQTDELPAPFAVSLPNAGGRYLFNVSTLGTKTTVTSNLSLNKGIYSSAEYHYIKELYSRIVQVNQSQIVLRKK